MKSGSGLRRSHRRGEQRLIDSSTGIRRSAVQRRRLPLRRKTRMQRAGVREDGRAASSPAGSARTCRPRLPPGSEASPAPPNGGLPLGRSGFRFPDTGLLVHCHVANPTRVPLSTVPLLGPPSSAAPPAGTGRPFHAAHSASAAPHGAGFGACTADGGPASGAHRHVPLLHRRP